MGHLQHFRMDMSTCVEEWASEKYDFSMFTVRLALTGFLVFELFSCPHGYKLESSVASDETGLRT